MRIVMVHVEGDDRSPALPQMLRRPVGDLAEDLAARGHEVRELGLFLDAGSAAGGAGRSWSVHSTARTLSTALATSGCDVVHGIGELGGRITDRALGGAPWTWSYDEADTGPGTLWWPRTARTILVPSEADARLLRDAGAPAARVRVVPERLVVDPAPGAHAGRSGGTTIVTTILDAGEGTADAVRALTRAPSLQLVVLADEAGWTSPERRRVQRLAHGLHVDDRVSWRLPLDRVEVHRAIAGSDLLVHAPRTRLDQRLVVTALGAGVPVVIADLEGADGLVVNGITGVRVQPGDPRRLALAMSIVAGDPRMREETSQAGRRHVRDTLNRDIAVDAVLAAYGARGIGRAAGV